MKHKIIYYFKFFPAAICAMVFAVLLIVKPEVAFEGVHTGLSLCAQTVIPSIFPFMVVSLFIVKSGIGEKLCALFSPVMKHIFYLPPTSACVFILGAMGGYPVGAKMTSSLLEHGDISENEAQRMIMFCVNAGPSFVISTIGYAILKDLNAGLIIYFSLLLSSVIIGLFLALIIGKKPIESNINLKCDNNLHISKALTQSCYESAASMISICSWIVLFSCIGNFLTEFISNESVLSITKCVLEVTSGCSYISGKVSLPVFTAVLGFSGLCVHMQILPDVLKTGVKIPVFIAMRLLHAGLSSVISYAFINLFPYSKSAFAPISSFDAYGISYSIPVAAGLILMGVLLIFEVAENKKIW